MKNFIIIVFMTNIFLFAQTSKEEKLEWIKSKGDIKVTEQGNDIYELEYPGGRTLHFNFGKTETTQTDSIPTTVIETWNVDTMLYKDMYYFWQEVPVSTMPHLELVIGDANNNGYPEIYGYVKDYEDPLTWMPSHIFELDSSEIFQDRFTYPDTISLPRQLYDFDLDGNKEIFLYMLDRRHIFFKQENPQSLPTTPDFIFDLYFDQIDSPNFGDFDKNGTIDFLFNHHVPHIKVVCEYNESINNFDPIFELDYPAGSSSGFAIGDFDMDDKTDFVYGSIDGGVFVIESKGEHSYSLVWESEIPGAMAYWQIATNDMNKNGKPEFWVSSTTYYGMTDVTRFTAFEYTGDNEYEEIHRLDFVGVFPLYTINGFGLDVDKDGTDELVICIGNYVFIMQYNGSNENPEYDIYYATRDNYPGSYFGVTMYDLDNSGYEELLIHRSYQRTDGKWKHTTFIYKPDFIVPVSDENKNVISNYSLEQNYPNPFNSHTIVSYNLPERSCISLKVFDILGNEIETLVNEEKQVGSHIIEFDGNNLTSGIYFYKLQAGNFTSTKKLILLK
jgi:hypothetical protein